MRFLQYISLQLSLAATIVSASCGSKQAKSWDDNSLGLRSPSWPWDCHKILIVDKPASYADVRAAYEITGYEFLVWNCFLECQDGDFDIGIKVCVDATLENPITRTPLIVPTFSKVDDAVSQSGPLSNIVSVSSEPPMASVTTLYPAPLPTTASASDGSGGSSRKLKLPRGLGSWALSGLTWSTTTSASASETSDHDSLSSATSTQSTTSEEYGSSESLLPSGWHPYTEPCDGPSDTAEDCRVTMDCDATESEYPTCVSGKCQCKTMSCSRDSECQEHG
jgi:hypothetical protein